MEKKKNSVYFAVVIVVVATLVGGVFAFLKYGGTPETSTMMSDTSADIPSQFSVEPDKSSTDYKMMASVSNEDYDRLFLANMIAHHQGAVDMANLALKNAKHQEIKVLASAIVSAQTTEIADMISWQKSWASRQAVVSR